MKAVTEVLRFFFVLIHGDNAMGSYRTPTSDVNILTVLFLRRTLTDPLKQRHLSLQQRAALTIQLFPELGTGAIFYGWMSPTSCFPTISHVRRG